MSQQIKFVFAAQVQNLLLWMAFTHSLHVQLKRGERHIGRMTPVTSSEMENGNVLWGREQRVRESTNFCFNSVIFAQALL